MKTLWTAIILLVCSIQTAAADSVEEIWKTKCQGCHGGDGRAKTKVGQKEKIPDMTSPKWQARHSDAAIKKTIQDGSDDNPKMKPFRKKLSEPEIDSLVSHIRGFKAQ
jgi:cytochrome c553